MTGSRRLSVMLCILLALLALRAGAQTSENRQAWLDARAAIRQGQLDSPVPRALRRYALYPYLESATIIAQLGVAESHAETIDAAADFLNEHEDSAVAETFRRELLLALSQLEAWEDFIAFYLPEAANEARECEYLRARVSLDLTQDLAPLVAARWLTARRLNSACEPAFRWLRRSGELDETMTVRRLELLLDEGQTEFARIIAAQLPEDLGDVYRQWADMLDAPLDSLDAIAGGALVPIHPEALARVWERASIRAPLETFERLDAVRAASASQSVDSQQLLLDLALGLAWDRRSESLEVFGQLDPAALDDYALGWLTRSAIWNGQWQTAERALRSMSADAHSGSDWTYWQARTAMQLGDTDAAQSGYASLLDRDNFYSAAAAAQLGLRVEPNDQPLRIPEPALEALAELDEFVRARELFLLGERVAATREWRYATRELDNASLAAAMRLASDWGWHDIAVATATRAQVFFDYARLYPQPFANEIRSAAIAHQLDAPLISALIRQESMFRSDAVSSAGAMGLMQLGLATARNTARTLGLARPARSDLFEPATNTTLGAATLRSGLGRFDQQLPVALAAYNAGPAAAQRWLPSAALDSDIWIENIPYNETRDYVRRVLWNDVVYRWLLADESPINTSYLLDTITATAAADD